MRTADGKQIAYTSVIFETLPVGTRVIGNYRLFAVACILYRFSHSICLFWYPTELCVWSTVVFIIHSQPHSSDSVTSC